MTATETREWIVKSLIRDLGVANTTNDIQPMFEALEQDQLTRTMQHLRDRGEIVRVAPGTHRLA